MVQAFATAMMGLLVVVGGLYASFRWIVMAGQPESRRYGCDRTN